MTASNTYSTGSSMRILTLVSVVAFSATLRISTARDGAMVDVECLGEGRFYRNPKHTDKECSKYYLCIGGDVFEFKCTSGLLFDVQRQICDFKFNVENCHLISESTTPHPLLVTEEPVCPAGELACGDRICKPRDVFCDDVIDCADASDEGYCDSDSDPNAASRCDISNCTLPYCFCSAKGTSIPGNLDPKKTPQMVILTFDDAVNFQNWDLYAEIFDRNRTNPNGCPIRGTFFVSHEYTNYRHVQRLWNDGHEIAVHSITHKQPEIWWTRNATLDDWVDEFVGMANILNRFAGIPMAELHGLRVPFLRVGWNRQFNMMKEFGFTYDSTMVAPYDNVGPPLWPYTLDHRMPHRCQGADQRCPSRSFPGIWEMVMNQIRSSEGHTCAMVDSCPTSQDEDEMYNFFMSNFKRHYESNRAPFGLYFHTVWFMEPVNREAFLRFVDDVRKKPDVYFVTNWQAIEWMRNPTSVDRINKDFAPWHCNGDKNIADEACDIPKACKLATVGKNNAGQGERYLYTCFECPSVYPWIKNEFGNDQ